MKVRIAKLKARLSHYLRLVRKGKTITVCDRDEPVAEIVPVRKRRLTIREPAPGSPPWYEVPVGDPLPPELARELMEEFYRERDRERDR